MKLNLKGKLIMTITNKNKYSSRLRHVIVLNAGDWKRGVLQVELKTYLSNVSRLHVQNLLVKLNTLFGKEFDPFEEYEQNIMSEEYIKFITEKLGIDLLVINNITDNTIEKHVWSVDDYFNLIEKIIITLDSNVKMKQANNNKINIGGYGLF
jgi:hypothetical protein